jgi:hypothetical protein
LSIILLVLDFASIPFHYPNIHRYLARLPDMNGIKPGPSVADLAAMTTEERMEGMEHSEVRYFTRSDGLECQDEPYLTFQQL